MYTEDDLKGMSIEEMINLINQITDERNLYRDKCNKLIEEKNVQQRRTLDQATNAMSSMLQRWKK